MTRRFVTALTLGTLIALCVPASAARLSPAPARSVSSAHESPASVSGPHSGSPSIDSALGSAGCATHAEWNDLQTFMTPPTVADLLGTNGDLISSNDTVFRRGYDVCWDSSKLGVVKYDTPSAFMISWRVRDR